ncbi:nucleolar protein 58-like isoform X2 [Aricia agestis]|uniref:nucleolar protein 58-like isoform X2 n=1 Tax=Aricia agestis TaxID=91739 RepID=UPI001C205451|nr:nucleolar protein 58-like isoform X2 [Aricia agestis]
MPLFSSFKKTFRLNSVLKPSKENGNIGEPICGAYRINREEFMSSKDLTKRNTSPIVQMTYTQPTLKHSHSTDNMLSNRQLPNTRQSMPEIAHPEPAPRKSKNEKEQRKVERHEAERKLELAQKKREKLVLKEQQIQKLNKEQEKVQKKEVKEQEKLTKKEVKEQEKLTKKEVKEQEKAQKKVVKGQEKARYKDVKSDVKTSKVKSKKNAVQQPQLVNVNVTIAPTRVIPEAPNYSTNTLDSSISRTSGPPPYTEEPNITPNGNDNTGNTSFSTPAEDFGSWDLISEHRQQLDRPKAAISGSRPTHMALHYDMRDRRDNSEV